MIHLRKKLFSFLFLIFVILVSFSFGSNVLAQPDINYFVRVNPTESESLFYTPVDSNCTVSFEAVWSYGDYLGNHVLNAVIDIQVNNTKSEIVDQFSVSSDAGIFLFNYSSSTADVLTFTPIKLVTQDDSEYSFNHFNGSKVYGLQSEPFEVWWDTFQVSLVSWETEVEGTTNAAVNVTYLLLPEGGLNLPVSAAYSNQTYLSKAVRNANVTINGNKALPTTSEGIYQTNFSTWLPTAYVHVDVSQDGWASKQFGFSFDHVANKMYWNPAVLLGLVFVIAGLMVVFIRVRRAEQKLFSQKNYPVLGAILLCLVSAVSLYWGLVALDSTLNGFNWAFLAASGLLSFGFGSLAVIFSMKKKNQALVLLVLNLPLFTNVILISHSLEQYNLNVPGLQILCYLVLNFIAMYLISNADEQFT